MMSFLRVLEIVFAIIAYGIERLLDYVRVHKPGSVSMILGCLSFFVTFSMTVTVATMRYRQGRYCIDWLHIIAGGVTIVASLLEFLQICEFIALEWFTEYPTRIAECVLEFNVAEALVVAASKKPDKAPLESPLPSLDDLMIFGELKEGKSVVLTGIVTGDVQACVVEWYPTDSSTFERELDVEPYKYKFYESYTIPLEAVGKYLVAKFIPTTLDGKTGEPLFAKSEKTIEAELPRCTYVLVSGDIIEGGLLSASYQYTGDREGASYLNWYIHEEKGQRGIIPEAWNALEYRIPKHAIGSFISFTCTPKRDDGKEGSELTWTGQERVPPAHPTVHNVHIEIFNSNSYIGVGEYFGGDEGESMFRWYKERSGEGRMPITGANHKLYTLKDDDYGWSLVCSYVPVRSDSKLGEPQFSLPTAPIFPELIRIGVLELKGEARVGETLWAFPVSPSDELQNLIREKFRKSFKFQWSVSMQDGTGYTPCGNNPWYIVKPEDVGRSIQCGCTIIDKFDRESPRAFAVTDAVVPGIPQT